jgi:hypothetical protein
MSFSAELIKSTRAQSSYILPGLSDLPSTESLSSCVVNSPPIQPSLRLCNQSPVYQARIRFQVVERQILCSIARNLTRVPVVQFVEAACFNDRDGDIGICC